MLVNAVLTKVAKSSCLHGSVFASDVDCAFFLVAMAVGTRACSVYGQSSGT